MIKKLLASAAGLLLAAQAAAGIVVDVVNQAEKVDWFDSYSYSHNLNDNGDFVLGSAVSGLLDVEIFDDQDRGRWIWRMELSGLKVENQWVDITAGTSFNNISISGQALASVNQNGILDVTIQSFWGDFYVGDSTLTLTTLDAVSSSTVVTSVPEPGLLILLSAGVVGLGFARAKQS